jgi:hypothetical protein
MMLTCYALMIAVVTSERAESGSLLISISGSLLVSVEELARFC